MNISTYIAITRNTLWRRTKWVWIVVEKIQQTFCNHKKRYSRRSGTGYCLKCGKQFRRVRVDYLMEDLLEEYKKRGPK